MRHMKSEGLAVRRSTGIGALVFCCILLLLTARGAFAQAPDAADDAPDPDALARVQSSDAVASSTGGFVHRVGDHFEQDGHYFTVKGVNFKMRDAGWDMWAYYYDARVQNRLDAELQKAHDLRANVIRVFLTVDDFGGIPSMWGRPAKPFFDSALTRLDDFLNRADAKGLKVLLTFYDGLNIVEPGAAAAADGPSDVDLAGQCRGRIGNPNSTGAYAWENTSPDSNSNTWYHGPDIRPFRNHIDGVLTRNIPGTTRTFANDARIFGWDLMNEPDHLYHSVSGCTNVFYNQSFVNRWLAWMARHARLYDTNHPITAGTYGWFLNPAVRDRYPISYHPETIQEVWNDTDFISIHWYQLNDPPYGDLNLALADTQTAGKPVMLEEIGQADSGYQDNCQPQPWNEAWVNNWTARWAAIAAGRNISGALVWTNYDFDPSKGGSPGWIQCGQTWYPRNGNHYGLYRTNDAVKTTGVTFRQNAFSPTCTRASFRTWNGTNYLRAETTGQRRLLADGTAGSHTAFTVLGEQSGGYYFALGAGGYYMSALNGGGGPVYVNQTWHYWWESFGIVPLRRLSSQQWEVALHAASNQYLSAEWAGGGDVNANRAVVREWERFVMTCE